MQIEKIKIKWRNVCSNVFRKPIITLDDMAQDFDLHIVVYNIPICLFFLLKNKLGSMCGEYGNPNLQVPLCPFGIQRL